VRIISGKYRGKQIIPAKDFSARPTTDFAKESLFNILGNQFDFEDIEVLDLFAGTGSISYEFASRGALRVDSIEMSPKYAGFIQKTASELKFDQLNVHRANVFQFIKRISSKYDIVFADPPYDLEGVDTLPALLLAQDALKEGGVFILEHSAKLNFSDNPRIIDHRNYGSVNFTFFR
jgi:16S rRNA (guanine(966)-N(2))-methyltransferase RsmD